MSQPPAHIPEQQWTYPPAHPPGGGGPSAIGGYYARGAAAPVTAPGRPATPIWQAPATTSISGKAIAAFVLAGLGVCLVVFFAMLEAGISETLVGAIVALVPLALVLGFVRWLDRWEPEPTLYLFLAFAWGAGVATATAMFINTHAFRWLSGFISDPAVVELLGVGLIAPVSEEFLKGIVLLALILWRRRLLGGAVDLVVYAATIASGFAFTENILYFARGSSQGILAATFFGRAIMSPFAHVMFTSALALVLAVVVHKKRHHLLWAFPLGLVVAIGLHGLWNTSAALAGADFLVVFVILHVPIFLTYVAVVVLLRRRERRHIVTHLSEYAAVGWFAPHEVQMLGSMSARSHARNWAKTYGARAGHAMAQFQLNATLLALQRRQVLLAAARGGEDLAGLIRHEQELLGAVQANREQFLTAAGPVRKR